MKYVMAFLVLLHHAATFVSIASSDKIDSGSGQGRELHVLLMTSSSQRFNSSGAETAVRLALDRVNADASILPGYELQLAGVRDSEVKWAILLVIIITTRQAQGLVGQARTCIAQCRRYINRHVSFTTQLSV